MMTARVVPLGSREANESRVPGDVSERLALVAKLSEMLWTRTGRALPRYTRATTPIAISTLRDQT